MATAMATPKEEMDAYIDFLFEDTEEDIAAEAAYRRKIGLPQLKQKKRAARASTNKAAAMLSADKAAARVNTNKAAAILSANKAAALERANGRVDGRSMKPKTMTEEDLAAAAVYRARAEEARRKKERKEEYDAVTKWIATGDPEAVKRCNQWLEEDMAAMDLAANDPSEDPSDLLDVEADSYRESWEDLWADSFGSWEDTTRIPPMRYTDEKPPPGTAYPIRTLQVFSVRIAVIQGGLEWPLEVYGFIAARDSLDHNRNIIFRRTRDNCQTIDKKNPCLTLTGPTRAVVVVDPVYFEVNLQVKGRTESEDRDLSYLVVYYRDSGSSESYAFKDACTSKLSTVALMLGDIVDSVEATISVRVVGGEWPKGCRGQIFARTASINTRKIELFAFGDDKLLVEAEDKIQLSRCVVSVEEDGWLKVSVTASWLEDQTVERVSKVLVFKAKSSSRSTGMIEVGSCKLEVTVAWSLVQNLPHFH